ncbi:MAG: hypothetical protein U0174_09580 [Polyangiaceae bacterium]
MQPEPPTPVASASPEAQAYFAARQSVATEVLRRLDRQTVAVSRLRVLAVLVGFGLLVGRVFAGLPEAAMLGAGASVIAFVLLVLWHGRLHTARDLAEARVAYCERALRRIEGNARPAPPPPQVTADPEHPFADDLDVIAPEGAASLWNLLDPAPLAVSFLRARLLSTAPIDIEDAREEQAAVRELQEKPALAEDAYVHGREVVDFGPLDRYLDGAAERRVPVWLKALGYLVPLANLTVWTLSAFGVVGRFHVTGALIASMVIGILSQSVLGEGLAAISAARDLGSYQALFRLLENETFTSARAREASALLRGQGKGGSASDAMASLSRILGFAQARENEVFRLIVGPLFAWDIHCVAALDAFRDRHGRLVRAARDTLVRFVTWATLGRLGFEQSGYAYPEFVPGVVFDAEGLAHPLLDPRKRVVNDVHMERRDAGSEASAFLVITGSNMAGKSTLLRALGLAVVLAKVGAPVCAKALKVGPLSVAASLRVRDSVGDGVSRFYAELRKVKRVLETARYSGRALCLLDEVFSGTNARERLLGAAGLLGALAETGSIGAVCTHDLELGNLAREKPGVFRNIHFEEQVDGDEMRFDYKIREGVVASSNALALMRAVGIDVV